LLKPLYIVLAAWIALVSGVAVANAHTGVTTDLKADLKADRILVIKSKRQLLLLRGGQVLKTFPISLGRAPEGHKMREGDGRTPEGVYRIDGRNQKSWFHRSLHISYPNSFDAKQAQRLGVSPGGAIVIHGLPKDYRKFHRSFGPDFFKTDWTEGCIAVSNKAIETIWELVENGTPIEIRPTTTPLPASAYSRLKGTTASLLTRRAATINPIKDWR
jgi:murein L,D-transpeptidase YafK